MFEYTPGTVDGSENPFALTEVARSTNHQGDLTTLSQVDNGYIQAAVAANPHTSLEVLTVLASSSNDFVRRAVAGNENSDDAILRLLVEDTVHWVRKAVALNPVAPLDALLLLARDENPFIAKAVAKRDDVTADILDALADYDNSYVQFEVARNPLIAASTVMRLLRSGQSKWVLYGLFKNPAVDNPVKADRKVVAAVTALRKEWEEARRIVKAAEESEDLLASLPDDVDDNEVAEVTDSLGSILARLAA